MPDRKYSVGTGYRYGFNGKENDNEVKGEGNQQDYGMRVYDPRLGKFLSVDPLTTSYPWYTPYQFSGNKPIKFIDLDGLEEATPEERQRAVSYFETSIKGYITSHASKRAFVNINPKTLTNELAKALKDPNTLAKRRSGVGSMCGVYAFTYVFALYDPVNFARGTADLYVTGIGHDIGGLDVGPDKSLKKASEDDPNSIPVLIFGGSIRSHYNSFVSYKGNRYFGSTGSGTMKAWLEDRLGAQVTEFDYGHETFSGISNADLPKLIDHINAGKHAVVRVSGNQYHAGANATKGTGAESDIFASGDHWVVFSGKMSLSDDKKSITFQAFDMNEGLVTKTMSTKLFKDMISHVLMIEKKPEKKP